MILYNPNQETTLSITEIITHEAGHNSAKVHKHSNSKGWICIELKDYNQMSLAKFILHNPTLDLSFRIGQIQEQLQQMIKQEVNYENILANFTYYS